MPSPSTPFCRVNFGVVLWQMVLFFSGLRRQAPFGNKWRARLRGCMRIWNCKSPEDVRTYRRLGGTRVRRAVPKACLWSCHRFYFIMSSCLNQAPRRAPDLGQPRTARRKRLRSRYIHAHLLQLTGSGTICADRIIVPPKNSPCLVVG